jgi:hypothetical protein
MISLQMVAAFLLLARIASDVYIYGVLKKQYELLKLPIHPALKQFRLVLFLLSIGIFIGNIIPIAIDGITVLGALDLGRPSALRTISVLYTGSNALTALLSAYLIHTLYRLAANDATITKYSSHSILEGDNHDFSDTIRGDKKA